MATKKKVTKPVSKKVTKPAAKKKATKKVSKKATAIAKVKAFKHKRIAIEPVPHDTLTELVKVTAGPDWASELLGKRYVSINYAIIAIDAIDAERNIAKGAKYVGKEMVAAGVTPLDTAEIETDEK
jgi:hypothetical protein